MNWWSYVILILEVCFFETQRRRVSLKMMVINRCGVSMCRRNVSAAIWRCSWICWTEMMTKEKYLFCINFNSYFYWRLLLKEIGIHSIDGDTWKHRCFSLLCVVVNDTHLLTRQVALLSQRGRAMFRVCLYTVSKKVYLLIFHNNFGKCGPIFKILSPTNSWENSLHKDCHLTCNILWHYLVKIENPKMLLILTASSTNCWHVDMFLRTLWTLDLTFDIS